jgi:tRNA dimethylallyltransferase
LLKLAALVGPTAVGKTELAIKIAQRMKAEIISCDSMQVYRGMNIGTAKASLQQQSMVPHHLLDIVEVDHHFTVAEYQSQAQELIRQINQRRKIPMLVGGTGLYYQAVVDNYSFYPMDSHQEVRRQLQQEAAQKGLPNLYMRLNKVDPDYAQRISPQDEKRIIRALEVYELTGKPFSEQQTRQVNTYNLASVGLYLEREILYQRINDRVDKMLQKGLIDEVNSFRHQGYGLHNNAMQALGYKQVLYYLDGLLTYQEMAEAIKKETRNYAKRQITWFKKDKRITWFDVAGHSQDDLAEKICAYMEGLLSQV